MNLLFIHRSYSPDLICGSGGGDSSFIEYGHGTGSGSGNESGYNEAYGEGSGFGDGFGYGDGYGEGMEMVKGMEMEAARDTNFNR
jgi:hypothetical protein